MAPFSMWGQQPAWYDFQGAPPQAQSSLRIEDLYTPYELPQLPQPPEAIQDFSGLDAARQKELRRQALLMAAGAIGQGLSTGRVGDALTQAALQDSQNRQGAIGDANQAQQQEFLRQRQIAEGTLAQRRFEAEDALNRREAEGALGLVSRIAEQEPGLAGQAEALARAGDFAALQKLAADIPRRAQMRQYGVSPDDPFADERIKGLLALRDKQAYEEWAKNGGYGGYFEKPPKSPEEIYAESNAQARGQADAWGPYRNRGGAGDEGLKPRFVESGDMWGLLEPQEGGGPRFTPAAGMEPRPRYQFVPDSNPWDQVDDSGWANPYDPNAPLIPRRKTDPPPSRPAPKPGAAPGRVSADPVKPRAQGGRTGVQKFMDSASRGATELLDNVRPGRSAAAPRPPNVPQGEVDKVRKKQAALRGKIETVRVGVPGGLNADEEKRLLTLFRQSPDLSAAEAIKRIKAKRGR